METQIKLKIKELRDSGVGYGEIAKALNIGKSTIASYCKRHGLDKSEGKNSHYYKYCGRLLTFIPSHKNKIFCCDRCRIRWWNENVGKCS